MGSPPDNDRLDKAKMKAAQALIERNLDAEALAVLKTITLPTAREWEARLRARTKRRRNRLIYTLGALVIVLAAATIGLGALLLTQEGRADALQQTALAAVATYDVFQAQAAAFNATVAAGEATRSALPVDANAPALIATLAAGSGTRSAADQAFAATATRAAQTRLGGLNNPIPAGQPLQYASGDLRVLSYERPTGYLLYRAAAGTEIVRAAPEQIFVAIELTFTCRAVAGVCDAVPEAEISLVLSDGSRITADPAVGARAVPTLSGGGLRAGDSQTGWRFFTIPAGQTAASLRISDPLSGSAIFGQLPAPVDGFTIPTAWEPRDDGGRQRRLPAFRRDLQAVGFTTDEVYLQDTPGEGTIVAVTLPIAADAAADAAALIAAVRRVALTASDVWRDYADLAPAGIGISVRGRGQPHDLGGVALLGSDIIAYNNGALSVEDYVARWFVLPGVPAALPAATAEVTTEP
ncbi:MAG: hypothetical protein GYB67_16110 [Chloroflexi bacterium]|nr:hypothetical protein [Chloroflexota bacterium]